VTISQELTTGLIVPSCVIVLGVFAVTTTLFADQLTKSDDPQSVGFSEARLARIGAWYQARVDSGDLSGSVVAIAKDGKLAYLQAVGFQDRSSARCCSTTANSMALAF
jgi:CubicO group peptidase (beta-lactamase class C family)